MPGPSWFHTGLLLPHEAWPLLYREGNDDFLQPQPDEGPLYPSVNPYSAAGMFLEAAGSYYMWVLGQGEAKVPSRMVRPGIIHTPPGHLESAPPNFLAL